MAFLLLPLFLMAYLKTNFSSGQTIHWLWNQQELYKDMVQPAHSSGAAKRQLCHQAQP